MKSVYVFDPDTKLDCKFYQVSLIDDIKCGHPERRTLRIASGEKFVHVEVLQEDLVEWQRGILGDVLRYILRSALPCLTK